MTGYAALDVKGSETVLTVDTSDKPYGLLTIAPSSLRVTTEESERTINIYINREFGASSGQLVQLLCINTKVAPI